MAKCNECGHVVSSKASACPNCGNTNPHGVSFENKLLGCGCVVFLLLALGSAAVNALAAWFHAHFGR